MKKYLVSYIVKNGRKFRPTNHNCIEYANNKKEIREYFPHKIVKIEEIKE